MARIEWVERHLREWAQWLMVGDGSGYSATNPLHSEWSPPTAGQTPTLKVAAPTSARVVDRQVKLLSTRLQATLLLHYCTNLSMPDKAQRLATIEGRAHPMTDAALRARIDRAHHLLAQALGGGAG